MATDPKHTGVPKVTNSVTKGMQKDRSDSFSGADGWTHARNAVNNTHDGQLGTLSTEPANKHCCSAPYDIIGTIPLQGDQWVIFSTNDTDSEIGIFDDSACSYTTVVNDTGLAFNRNHLITGATRRTFDCSEKVYFADGLNPDRVLDLTNVPWKLKPKQVGRDCNPDEIELPKRLDTERIRLAPLLDIPCLTLEKAKGSGMLPNGTYQVVAAYSVNEIKVTDYLALSNTISVWAHGNTAGALELNISATDTEFDQMEVVVISIVNGQTVAKRLGIYSTGQTSIYIDHIDATLPTIPLANIPLQTPAVEKSDAIFSVGDYLLRSGVYSKPDFNYQPLANGIVVKWVSAKYPADYYRKGGMNPSNMRDEVYPYFIRWVYNTGERSASYHVPGRPMNSHGINDSGWATGNTATVSPSSGTTSDGGIITHEGYMGYHESTERYPDNNSTVWGSLCGKPIRHHRMPDNTKTNHFNDGGETINVLGVKFENIKHPLDNAGNPIMSIVGYEILRGSREGNKTVIAKGMLNNMREYTIEGSDQKGLFQNYPYNQLSGDPYYDTTAYSNGYLSFHSPDTTFNKPYVGQSNLTIYEVVKGTAKGCFESCYKHPEFRLLSSTANIVSEIVGILSAITSVAGAALGSDITFGATEDVPMSIPMLLDPGRIPGGMGPLGAATIALQVAVAALNATSVIAMAPITKAATKQKMIDLITGLIPHRQYAAQYDSHGFYNEYTSGRHDRTVEDYTYVGGNLQSFGDFRVNNLYRNNYVLLKLNSGLPDLSGDNSRFTLTSKGAELNKEVTSSIRSYYGALKVNLPAQYGQLDSIRQVPIPGCVNRTIDHTASELMWYSFSSPVLFGGDVYINRYTEKNPFLFFNDWLIDQPNDYQYDYRNYFNLPKPKFWIDNRKAYHGIFDNITNYRSLDGGQPSSGIFGLNGFYMEKGNFYLFCNGVRDFFVESEVNVAYREWDDEISKRFYDPYGFTDLSYMFRSDVMKSPAYYKYDYSLSVSRFYNQFISWGSILPRSFDPVKAETCYNYYPRRVMYSLPQTEEFRKDNWQSFLVNNYKDFSSKVTAIRNVGKTGAIMMLENESPILFNGVDTLQTDAGTKITIGDGGLFNQALQNVSNADAAYQYGSCQSRNSVTATPGGIFWVSQKQGKIFGYGNGMEDITRNGMKWWFSRYLPSQLLEQFPDFAQYDNPVTGVGVQTVYDPTNEVLYITKKDYRLKDGKTVYYSPDGGFYTELSSVELTNTAYFEDISWTVSYDIKNKMWVSYHDWHPEWMLGSSTHFVTVKGNGLWKHNQRYDLFCNFYGVDYPFEVEYIANSGTEVATVRGLEYQLECFEYKNNGTDKFHVLDHNFDRAIVHNTEQMSGLLKLLPKKKNNPLDLLQYPKVTSNGIEILYSKEEQKYRFNTFFDVTSNRGEFDPNIRYQMFLTNGDGYTFEINPLYVDYNKSPLHRKKLRHYNNKVFLRKTVPGNRMLVFKNISTKLQLTSR